MIKTDSSKYYKTIKLMTKHCYSMRQDNNKWSTLEISLIGYKINKIRDFR